MQIIQEFKTFALRGNLIDMAVGIIIGGAFGKIVSSLVNDVLLPPIGMLLGGNFSDLAIRLGAGDKPAALKYGAFMQSVVDFIIVAAAVFLLIKVVNRATLMMNMKCAPTTKQCPRCFSTIALQATRCPHCTSELD